MSVEIKGLVEASLIDWPGKLATVVFVPGCNLRCRYCHARDLVTGADAIDPISFEHVLDYLEESRGWIDGVVISGGEPTLYGGLADLARSIRSRGFGVKLDTNGTRPAVIERLLSAGLLDAVSMDVKAPLDYRYFEVTRFLFDLNTIRRSIEMLMHSGLEYEFRTTVVPDLISPLDIGEIARAIEGARRYTLQGFNPHACLDPALESRPPCPSQLLEDSRRMAEGFVEKVHVRV